MQNEWNKISTFERFKNYDSDKNKKEIIVNRPVVSDEILKLVPDNNNFICWYVVGKNIITHILYNA